MIDLHEQMIAFDENNFICFAPIKVTISLKLHLQHKLINNAAFHVNYAMARLIFHTKSRKKFEHQQTNKQKNKENKQTT